MKAYRAKLIKAGRMLEARAVAQCIKLATGGTGATVHRWGIQAAGALV